MSALEATIYAVMVLVTYVWLRFNRAALDDALSPFNLLLPFWVLPYLASLLKLSGFQRGLTIEAHALVISATLAMILPSLASAYLLRPASLSSSLSRFSVSPLRYPVGRVLAIGFLLVTVWAHWTAVFAGRGIPLAQFAAGGLGDTSLHLAGMQSKLQILAHAMHIAGAMVLYVALTGRPGFRRLALFALAAIPPVLGILRAFKSDIFITFIYYGAVTYYYRRSRKLPLPTAKLVLILIIFLVLLSLITTLRTTGVASPALYSRLIEFKYIGLPFPINEILGVTYGYGPLTFENFGRFVEYGQEDLRLGTSMFRPSLSVFMQGRVADGMLAGINWHPVGLFANAPNGLTDLYVEGGPLLCVVGPLVYGVLVNSIYIRFRQSGSSSWLFVYLNFVQPWVWMFFSNAFSVLGYYADAFYIVALSACAAWIHHWMQSTRTRIAQVV